MNPTPEQLATTSRRITAGIWCCATITMTASVVNGTSVFAALTDGVLAVLVGLLTALAVDAALVVVLTGDARMQSMGLSAGWGWVLRWVILAMSLALNSGASALVGHWFLAGLHAIPPLLLCGLSEYGQEVGLRFAAAVRAHQEADATADRNLARAKELETHRLTVARELTAELQRKAAAAEALADQEERLAVAKASQVAMVEQATAPVLHLTPRTARDRGPSSPGRRSPVRAAALRWLSEQHQAGRDVTAIGPAELARVLNASPNTVKAGHKDWKDAVLAAVSGVAG